MAEEILNQIAEDLRGQVVTEPVAVQEPVVENNQEVTSTQEEPKVVEQKTSETEESNEGEWYDKKIEVKSESNNQEVNQSSKAEIELDEDLKLIADYKKTGKSLADFVKEYQVEDFSKWNDEKFVEEGLKSFMTLEQEEIEQALYEYKNSSVFQKKQLVESFKEKFERQNQEKLKQLKGTNSDLEIKTQAIADKYRSDLEQYSQQIVNKEMYGIKITDEMSNKMKKYIDTEFSIQKEDGSFDIEKVYDIALWLTYGADLVKANVTKAKNEGREQVLKEVSNPSRNMSSSGKLVSSGLEAVQDAFNNLFPG